MTDPLLFAVCPPGLEPVVAAELAEHGFAEIEAGRGGVTFRGDALRANRVLATATRVLQRVATFPAKNFKQLQARTREIDWSGFGGLTPQATCRKSRLYHSGAVEERLAAVVPPGPGALLARLERDVCTLSVDTSGERLHRRGWRVETGAAPLRETLAASILRLAEWQPGVALYDPMCGSGTFLIEGAVRAAGVAPGAQRTFACEGWLPEAPMPTFTPVPTAIVGGDRSAPAVGAAQRNAERAGVVVDLRRGDARNAEPPAETGLLVCNPPYGRRAGGVAGAYDRLGALLRGPFAGWRAAVLVPDRASGKRLGRTPTATHRLKNGGLSITLVICDPS